MKHNDILQYIKEQFVLKFSEYMKKTSDISYETIIDELCYENSLEKDTILALDELKGWFNNIYHQEYLNVYLNLSANEVMLKDPNYAYLFFHNYKEKYQNNTILNEDYNKSLELLAYKEKQKWNYTNPFVSFQIIINKAEYRCSLIHRSASVSKYHQIFLRKLGANNFGLEDFIQDNNLKSKIKKLINDKRNIIVAGSTGSGKTTFLNSLVSEIPSHEHIVCIEDTKEIYLDDKLHSRLLSQKEQNKSMKDYCKYALRMSPERILLGEIRAEEIVSMVLAMNTGHDGFMSTIHANNAKDTLHRLALLFNIHSDTGASISYNQIMKLICSNIDYVIFMKDKEISEIIRVIGAEKDCPIFEITYIKNHEEYSDSAQYH